MRNDNGLLQLQDGLYKILIDFDRICEEHNLTYFLSYGTLLGAVRHQGFIPWDDDIDVAMPREDYDKLIINYKDILPNLFELHYYKNTPNYHLNYAKIVNKQTTIVEMDGKENYRIHGIYLDIFPIDGVGNTFKRAIKHRKLAGYYIRLTSWASYSKAKIRSKSLHARLIINIIQLLFNGIKMKERTVKFLRKKSYVGNNFVSICVDLGNIMQKSVFGSPQKIKFRNHFFNAPANPTEYLIAEYGEDYMQLPTEDKRMQHDYVYMNLDLPYEEFDIRNFKDGL